MIKAEAGISVFNYWWNKKYLSVITIRKCFISNQF